MIPQSNGSSLSRTNAEIVKIEVLMAMISGE